MARPKEKQEEEKKETGKKYLPVQKALGNQGTDGPGAGKGNPFHEPGGAEGETRPGCGRR